MRSVRWVILGYALFWLFPARAYADAFADERFKCIRAEEKLSSDERKPCYIAVCTYQACITAHTTVKPHGVGSMQDPGGVDAARAACSPHYQILESCAKVYGERTRRQREESTVQVVSGTYGANCGASRGNKTNYLAAACNGQKICTYVINYKIIGDPAVGCAKNYTAEWRCGGNSKVYKTFAYPEAGFGRSVVLSCP